MKADLGDSIESQVDHSVKKVEEMIIQHLNIIDLIERVDLEPEAEKEEEDIKKRKVKEKRRKRRIELEKRKESLERKEVKPQKRKLNLELILKILKENIAVEVESQEIVRDVVVKECLIKLKKRLLLLMNLRLLKGKILIIKTRVLDREIYPEI